MRTCCIMLQVRFLCPKLRIYRLNEMDELLKQSLLYDYYGELLTPHQRTVYEGFVFDDMSLGEIAAEQGISRQGVHDLVKRCDKALLEYEEKLHLVERFASAKEKISRIQSLAAAEMNGEPLDYKEKMEQIRAISEELLSDL